jgi:hypothetical protein
MNVCSQVVFFSAGGDPFPIPLELGPVFREIVWSRKDRGNTF